MVITRSVKTAAASTQLWRFLLRSLQGILCRRFTGCLRRHGELIVRAGFRLTIRLELRLDRDRRR